VLTLGFELFGTMDVGLGFVRVRIDPRGGRTVAAMICVPPTNGRGRSAPPTLERDRNEDKSRCQRTGNRVAGVLIPGWLLLVALLGVSVLSGISASAQTIGAGTWEWTIATAGGATLPKDDRETVTSFQLLPHVGYFATNEVGKDAVRGNLEILVEPTLIHLDAEKSATVAGVSILPRWLFAASPRVRPYLEAGAGILVGEIDLRQTNCDVNFLLAGGAGAMVFLTERVALTFGARVQHISNADRCSQNEGLNSIIGLVGFSYLLGPISPR
jgi:hypothetical protein